MCTFSQVSSKDAAARLGEEAARALAPGGGYEAALAVCAEAEAAARFVACAPNRPTAPVANLAEASVDHFAFLRSSVRPIIAFETALPLSHSSSFCVSN